jgi:hypothetical protein
MRDGARDALSGYLYQFIQVAALRSAGMLDVSASELQENDSEINCKLIADVRRGRLTYEQRGQDAIIRIEDSGSDETVAVQFKSSRSDTHAELDSSELIEILRSFDASRRAAEGEGQTIDRFVVVTSKSLAESARSAIQQRHERRLPTDFSRRIQVKQSWVKKDYESRDNALRALHAVLARMDDPIENVRIESSVRWLETFAKHLGLNEAEIRDGITRIIGSILETTARGPLSITREWLNERFTRAPNARVLHLASSGDTARNAAAERLKSKPSEYFWADPDELIPRDRLPQLREQAALFPIVFLIGHGGCGKSVLAAQYLLEESAKRLVLMLAAPEAQEDECIGRELKELRSGACSQDNRADPITTVIDRLCIANEGAEPPYVLVDLDGLDEVSDDVKSGVRRVINRFRVQGQDVRPRAVLLLTCRAPSRDPTRAIRTLISDWFYSEYPEAVEDRVGKVFIGDFDEQEIRRAAQNLDAETRIRIETALSRLQATTSPVEALGPPVPRGIPRDSLLRSPLLSLLPPAIPRDSSLQGIVLSLHHPAMWGVFAKLSQEQRARILDGESGALSALAEGFIERFCRKANRRHSTLNLDQTRDALRRVSAASPAGNPSREKQADWVDAARGPLADLQSLLLYEEALSYGLIEVDQGGKWRWRHTHVFDWLRTEESP